MHLPLLERRTAELETCAFCPKLSRAACPVSAADGRETTTPWGKMTASYLLAKDAVEASPEQAFPPWACTGCFACRQACDLRNDVAGTLLDARADLMRAGLAPEAATRVVERHKERTAASDAGLAAAVERARARGANVAKIGSKEAARAELRLVVGCLSSRAKVEEGGDDVAADAIVATAALAKVEIAVVPGCCGAPLRMAGDRAGFIGAGRLLAERAQGAKHLVVADAGCAHAIARRYPEVGVELPAALEVLHLSELAARHLTRIPAPKADSDDQSAPVRYHDACTLGRGLGVYEAPRAVLTRVLGRAPDEFAWRREWASCSGGGGLLPSTYPENAAGIADARRTQHRELGGGAIVTTCGSSRKNLAKDGTEVHDLATMICRALGK
jgi:Fe-S oxidoreductase